MLGSRLRAAAATVGTVVLFATACATPASPVETTAIAAPPPVERAVTIETTACGHASKTSGAGVIVGDRSVLVSAHVVIGADQIMVTRGDQPDRSVAASITHLDTRTDLALLDVPGVAAEPIKLAEASAGDKLYVIGGGPSGSFATTITRRVEVRIDEVRSPTRSSRFGYELDHRVNLGDSGAGAFDASGRLVAIIYGRSQGRSDASFAVRRQEIATVLSEQGAQSWSCDPTQHRVIADG